MTEYSFFCSYRTYCNHSSLKFRELELVYLKGRNAAVGKE